MPTIDPTVTWSATEARLAVETDPVLRRNLELLLQHQRAEAALDLDALMATVSENAHYHNYAGTPYELVGKVAVRQFYEAFAASGCHRLQHDVDVLVVDRHCIFTDGVIRIAYPGRVLAARGIDGVDADTYYLFETRMGITWPIGDDGLFIGEDSYASVDGFAGIAERPLAEGDFASP